MFVLKGHTAKIVENALAFSPDGRCLVSGSADNTARVWELATRTLRRTFRGHDCQVNGAGFVRGGSWIATVGWTDGLRLWDATTGKKQKLFRADCDFNCLAVSPDGSRAAAAGDEVDYLAPILLYDIDKLAPLEPLAGHPREIGALVFSPDGRFLASGSSDRTARVWDLASGQQRALFRNTGWVQGLAFSPDSSALAVAAGRTVKVFPLDGSMEKVEPSANLTGHRATVYSVVFTPDGKHLISGSKDGSVRIWDLGGGGASRAYRWKIGPVWAVAVAPDGMTAAAGGDGDIVVWDLE
jgi:WD40 repeat protein